MSISWFSNISPKLDQMIRYGGTRNESTLRKPFQDLLEQYAHSKKLVLVPEVEYITKTGVKCTGWHLKGCVTTGLGVLGKQGCEDDLNLEIESKLAKGYPTFNILFEDTHTAVLYQSNEEVMRAPFNDAQALDAILTLFVVRSSGGQGVSQGNPAVYSRNAPILANTLRVIINEQFEGNSDFQTALCEFLELCKKTMNPRVEMADVREMIIQHVLTEDIFMRVFDEAEFTAIMRSHTSCRKWATFSDGDTKRNIHAKIAPYYETINARHRKSQTTTRSRNSLRHYMRISTRPITPRQQTGWE